MSLDCTCLEQDGGPCPVHYRPAAIKKFKPIQFPLTVHATTFKDSGKYYDEGDILIDPSWYQMVPMDKRAAILEWNEGKMPSMREMTIVVVPLGEFAYPVIVRPIRDNRAVEALRKIRFAKESSACTDAHAFLHVVRDVFEAYDRGE
jgi:hypothetical protein